MRLERRPPFPGMDPWLEHPALWPDVHNSLIVAIRDALAPLVEPRYVVGVEEHTYFLSYGDLLMIAEPDLNIATATTGGPPPVPGIPKPTAEGDVLVLDVEIPVADPLTEAYLEIRHVETRRVVTVIEVLSPVNKGHSKGRRKYLRKREAIAASRTSFVEIDLLRAGRPMPFGRPIPDRDYRILVRRGGRRMNGAKLYMFSYKNSIPQIPVPLAANEPSPPLDLTPVAHDLFDRARYYLRVNYSRPPVPPLRPEDLPWAEAIIAQARAPDG
jgi:hypothetical protein